MLSMKRNYLLFIFAKSRYSGHVYVRHASFGFDDCQYIATVFPRQMFDIVSEIEILVAATNCLRSADNRFNYQFQCISVIFCRRTAVSILCLQVL